MARRPTVKVREHQGTHSLDLTIPTAICDEFRVKPGDVFEVSALGDKGQVSLTYKRVYEARD